MRFYGKAGFFAPGENPGPYEVKNKTVAGKLANGIKKRSGPILKVKLFPILPAHTHINKSSIPAPLTISIASVSSSRVRCLPMSGYSIAR